MILVDISLAFHFTEFIALSALCELSPSLPMALSNFYSSFLYFESNITITKFIILCSSLALHDLQNAGRTELLHSNANSDTIHHATTRSIMPLPLLHPRSTTFKKHHILTFKIHSAIHFKIPQQAITKSTALQHTTFASRNRLPLRRGPPLWSPNRVGGWGVEPRMAPPPTQGVEREIGREREVVREREEVAERLFISPHSIIASK